MLNEKDTKLKAAFTERDKLIQDIERYKVQAENVKRSLLAAQQNLQKENMRIAFLEEEGANRDNALGNL